jgi:phosphatidate cytidylyltransferase
MSDGAGVDGAGTRGGVAVRVASAAVLAPIVLGAGWFGGPVFAGLALVAGVIMAWEWTRLVGGAGRTQVMLALYTAAVIVACAGAYGGYVNETVATMVLFAVVAFVVAPRRGRQSGTLFACGVAYVTLPLIAFITLRGDPDWGLWCVVWLLVLIWTTDSAAFFAGRAIGGPKLAPTISPKKTWSGACAGTAAACAAGLIFAWALGLPNMWIVGLASVVLSVLGQGGDLLESALKRRFGVKDASNIIPGHGGMLDRLDSLVVAGTVAWVVGAARAGHAHAANGILIW